MNRIRLGQVRPSSLNDVTIAVMCVELVAHLLLRAVEVEWREELAVRHRLEVVRVPADADEFLDVRVPRRDVVVGDRPVHPVALTFGRGELVFAPALAGAPPDQRLAADLISADPVERFLLDVRMVCILYEKMGRVFAVAGRFADERIVVDHLPRQGAAMRQLPGHQVRRRIVLDVLDVAPALEDERLQPLLAELLRRPSARDPRADDDCVVLGRVSRHQAFSLGEGDIGGTRTGGTTTVDGRPRYGRGIGLGSPRRRPPSP